MNINMVAYGLLSVAALIVLSESPSLPFAKALLSRQFFLEFIREFTQSKLNVVMVVNLLYCLLLFFARAIQHAVFGRLTAEERTSIREVTFNHASFKVVFLTAILDAQDIDEVLVWLSCFVVVAIFRAFVILCKHRFDTAVVFVETPRSAYVKNLIFVGCVAILNVIFAVLCGIVFKEQSWDVLYLLLFDSFVLMFEISQIVSKLTIHLWSLRLGDFWSKRERYIYYAEFISEVCVQMCNTSHYLHIWSIHGVAFTIIDMFLFVNLRASYKQLKKRITDYRSYAQVLHQMNTTYEDASSAELNALDDKCAICRENMNEGAKKLPCSHMFHLRCLQTWLKYKRSCPICRAALLSDEGDSVPQNANGNARARRWPRRGGGENRRGVEAREAGGRPRGRFPPAGAARRRGVGGPNAGGGARRNNNARQGRPNAVFRFDSSQWASWLPSFAFEILRDIPHVQVVDEANLGDGDGGDGDGDDRAANVPSSPPPAPRPRHRTGHQRHAIATQVERVVEAFPGVSQEVILRHLVENNGDVQAVGDILARSAESGDSSGGGRVHVHRSNNSSDPIRLRRLNRADSSGRQLSEEQQELYYSENHQQSPPHSAPESRGRGRSQRRLRRQQWENAQQQQRPVIITEHHEGWRSASGSTTTNSPTTTPMDSLFSWPHASSNSAEQAPWFTAQSPSSSPPPSSQFTFAPSLTPGRSSASNTTPPFQISFSPPPNSNDPSSSNSNPATVLPSFSSEYFPHSFDPNTAINFDEMKEPAAPNNSSNRKRQSTTEPSSASSSLSSSWDSPTSHEWLNFQGGSASSALQPPPSSSPSRSSPSSSPSSQTQSVTSDSLPALNSNFEEVKELQWPSSPTLAPTTETLFKRPAEREQRDKDFKRAQRRSEFRDPSRAFDAQDLQLQNEMDVD